MQIACTFSKIKLSSSRESQGGKSSLFRGNNVYGIMQDASGYMWISTDNGLSRLDSKTGMFKNFTTTDGLPGNSFNNLAFFPSQQPLPT